jgi:adenosine 3'-phospho 5'-phosphosulfate transporter B3
MGAIFIFAGTVGSGELFDATAFCVRQPQQVAYMLVWSLAGYLGVNVVLTLVQRFGALIAVTVTNCRKAVTIVLSFVFFSKPFTSQSVIARTRTHTQCTYPRYIWAGLVVLLGIYLNVYAKNQERWNAQAVGAMQAVLKCYQQLQLRRSRWRKHEPLVESV